MVMSTHVLAPVLLFNLHTLISELVKTMSQTLHCKAVQWSISAANAG